MATSDSMRHANKNAAGEELARIASAGSATVHHDHDVVSLAQCEPTEPKARRTIRACDSHVIAVGAGFAHSGANRRSRRRCRRQKHSRKLRPRRGFARLGPLRARIRSVNRWQTSLCRSIMAIRDCRRQCSGDEAETADIVHKFQMEGADLEGLAHTLAAMAACFLRNTFPKTADRDCESASSSLRGGTRGLMCGCDGGGNPKST